MGPLLSGLFEVGRVLGVFEVSDAHEEEGYTRHHHGDAPADDIRRAKGHNDAQHQRHSHLRHTTAQVAPSGGSGVGRPHHVGGEHHRGVVLGDDKGGPDDADCQAKQQEGLVAVGQPDGHHRNGADNQEPRVGNAGSDAVAQPTHHQPGHDGNGHGSDDRVADFGLGKLQVVAHNGHHWRDAEPAEEGQEEGHPAHVEYPHMRVSEAEQRDIRRFSG